MSSMHLHATGTVHPDEAWDRYLHPAKWSDWSPQIRGVETAFERIDPGVTGRVLGPLGFSAPFVVDAVDDAAREWLWSVDIGIGTLQLMHWVRPGPERGTTTGLTVSGPMPLVVGYVPLAAAALQRLVRP